MESTDSTDEINILLLGETGVGKSTWINGILNYLTFKTLDEAVNAEDFLYTIPMSFTFMDENYQNVRVRVGTDANEKPDSTSSSTQYPRSYTFLWKNKLVRMIDTPGIGDPKGVEQDKINFDRILTHLTHIDKLNGVCILLKPNETRLSVVFRFCIMELLTHLHRDASKNIVFCFTNARAAFYKPGETVTSLIQLLNEIRIKNGVDIPVNKDRLYAMDNEAIRLLAAMKQGSKFTQSDQQNYSTSWSASVSETKRLFKYIEELSPHMTSNTLSLNQVRNMIPQLTKPLADISTNIEDNIRLLKRFENEIATIDSEISDLESRLRIPVIRLKYVDLGFPRTVCGSSKCIERVLTSANTYTNVFSQVCHDHCLIQGVSTGTTNQVELQECWAMDDGKKHAKCRICECGWFDHMHRTYDIERIDDFDVNKDIENKLKNAEERKSKISDTKTKVANKIKQLEIEVEEITRIGAKFAIFLKKNAISPFNDATADYLDYLIKIEQQDADRGVTQNSLEQLKTRKLAHEKEKSILEASLNSASDIEEQLSPEHIQKEVEALFNLPENGDTIKMIFNKVIAANQKASAHREISLNSLQDNLKLPKAGGLH